MKKNLIKFAFCLCLPGLVYAATAVTHLIEEEEHRGRGVCGPVVEDGIGTYRRGPSLSGTYQGTLFFRDGLGLGFVAKLKKKKKKEVVLGPDGDDARDRSSSTGSSSGANNSSDSE